MASILSITHTWRVIALASFALVTGPEVGGLIQVSFHLLPQPSDSYNEGVVPGGFHVSVGLGSQGVPHGPLRRHGWGEGTTANTPSLVLRTFPTGGPSYFLDGCVTGHTVAGFSERTYSFELVGIRPSLGDSRGRFLA
jgi:hypothetical protein